MTPFDRILQPPPAREPLLPEGRIRTTCEDFVVEEIPEYEPSGEGEHLFLWIEKRDLAAGQLLTVLGKGLKVSSRDIGVAGQKDRRAVTRQFVSVPASAQPNVASFDDDRINVLSVTNHKNKLRTGHLKGNRFRIVLRFDDAAAIAGGLAKIGEQLRWLEDRGMPNYFGPQRFGYGANTARDGIEFIKGECGTSRWPQKKRRHMKRLAASSAQSAVFNLCLADRIEQGTQHIPGPGDVVCREGGIRPFLFDDFDPESGLKVIPMGPLPGPKMMAAQGASLEAELASMNQFKLTPDDFARQPKLTPGARRPYVIHPFDCSVETESDSATLSFSLPSGSFATVLLTQIVKQLTTVDRD